jgi:hypothetical protein
VAPATASATAPSAAARLANPFTRGTLTAGEPHRVNAL